MEPSNFDSHNFFRKANKKISNLIFVPKYVDYKIEKQNANEKKKSEDNSDLSLVFADKFGDIFIAKVPSMETSSLLLGHIAIVTCMVRISGF